MTEPVVDSLLLSDVYEVEVGSYALIHFVYQHFEYSLKLVQDGGKHEFMALDLIHMTLGEICPFCQKTRTESNICAQMGPYLSDLMDQLVEFPKLRLKWLFRDYV